MPSLESWLTFLVASEALLILPGPTVVMVISYALSRGRRAALMTVPGVALGDLTAMMASFLGLGAVLATSAEAFTLVKLAGAAYLVYLGVRAISAPIGDIAEEVVTDGSPPFSISAHAFVVTALNPKGIAFYVAFFPLFLDADLPLAGQLFIFGGSFLALAIGHL